MFNKFWYKWCAVPQCDNSSKRTPDKLFVTVPKNNEIRKKWLELARRNPEEIMSGSTIYFCEDHFDMGKDMANYLQYKMGYSQRLIMVNGALPSKFECQQGVKRNLSESIASTSAATETCEKRRKLDVVEESKEELEQTEKNVKICVENGTNIMQNTIESKCAESLPMPIKETTTIIYVTTAVSTTELKEKVHYKSKAIQTSIATRSVGISPVKPFSVRQRQPKSRIKRANKTLTSVESEQLNHSSSVASSSSSSSKVSDSDNTLQLITRIPTMTIPMASNSKLSTDDAEICETKAKDMPLYPDFCIEDLKNTDKIHEIWVSAKRAIEEQQMTIKRLRNRCYTVEKRIRTLEKTIERVRKNNGSSGK